MNENEIIKRWLKEHPPIPLEERLPKGWEIRFGRPGKFMKYESTDHVERKNQIFHREKQEMIAFGYCNEQWERMKAKAEAGDEFWAYGEGAVDSIILSRNGEIIDEMDLRCY